MNFIFVCNREETKLVIGTPLNLVDDFIYQLILAHDLAGLEIPDNEVAIFVSTSQEHAVGADRDGSDTAGMKVIVDGNSRWERLQVVWAGKLRNQLARIAHIDFLFEKSGAHIEVKASFEVFLDQVFVKRHFPQGFYLLGDVVQLAVFWLCLIPLFSFLFVEEELIGWVE